MILFRAHWLLLVIIIHYLGGCKNALEKTTADGNFSGSAQWIQDQRELPKSDSLFYLNYPAPMFRKEFKVGSNIEKAILFITAAGYFKATINGNRVGKNILEPAWTDYSKRIYYSEFDVASLINKGNNCIGVTLGNGFYNPLPLRKWGRRNLRNDLSVGKPEFTSNLVVYYQNGQIDEFKSDTTWKYSYGPLVKNSVYLGVAYDARKEVKGWDQTGFDDHTWNTAMEGNSPGGKIQKAFFPPVQITDEITPVAIHSPKQGVHVVDMGVNFTGTYKIKLSGTPGDTIHFRFGERIYKDGSLNPMTTVIGQIKRKGVGGPGAPDVAWQTDSYIIGDESEAWFMPEFTYHTYRYMEITGLSYTPRKSHVVGLFTHSNVRHENVFSCSSDLLNEIQEAVIRTFRANLISVQSDCPAREKFAYGGDLNATSESFIYNFDMQDFYRKTVYDWVDAINDSVFVDTAPYVGIKYCGISWESAFLITQYYLYLYYNDTKIIEELYEMDKRWMEKVAKIHPEGIVNQGLSDHESLEPVPVQLTGTSHYLQCAEIMQTFATVMSDSVNAKKYEKLANTLKDLLREEFWEKPVNEEINRQTLFSTLIYHKIIPEDEMGAAEDSLLKAVSIGPSGHFSTGIFGTKYILESLSQRFPADLVFNIVNSTEFPGWGFMIDRGATTIWETWKESDNTFSNCHPMFGTVTEWYFRWLSGIRPDPSNPGFKKFMLAPKTPIGLQYVNSSYNTPFGQIVSNWKKEQNGSFRYEMKIPSGTQANIELPMIPADKIELQKGGQLLENDKFKGIDSGRFLLGEGDYVITVYPMI